MKLNISEAISLILALPAHRSSSEPHRKTGERAFDILFEYQVLGKDDKENAFNRAMVCSVLSATRVFSVERDRIKEVWKSIEAVKIWRGRFLKIIRNLSPLSEGNYWTKSISILAAIGLSLSIDSTSLPKIVSGSIFNLIIILVILEILSKLVEFLAASYFEVKLPSEKEKKWKEKSLYKYKTFIGKFIEEAVTHYKTFYPEQKEVYGFSIYGSDGIEKLKQHFIGLKVYSE